MPLLGGARGDGGGVGDDHVDDGGEVGGGGGGGGRGDAADHVHGVAGVGQGHRGQAGHGRLEGGDPAEKEREGKIKNRLVRFALSPISCQLKWEFGRCK